MEDLFASQKENEWPTEDHTNPFAQPERAGICNERLPRKWANAACCKFGDSMNAKTDRKATAPVPAGILGGECIRAADIRRF
jgi:hypothetical protein